MSGDVELNPGPDSSRLVPHNISIVNLNVNSLRFKTDLISTELCGHDIICITESRLDNTVNNANLCIDNFQNPEPFRKDRISNTGSGLLVYIRDNLFAKRRPDLEIAELESLCIEICNNSKKFLLVCIYRPPNARAISWDHIDSLFDKCIESDLDCIFLGDINVDVLTISNSHKFSRSCERLGLKNVVQEPTRITPTSSVLR